MLKVHFRYEHLPEINKRAAQIIVFDSDALPDGTHPSSNCTFEVPFLEKLSDEELEMLYDSLIPAINACIQHLEERKVSGNDNTAA